MELYGKMLNFAMPIFVLLVVLEKLYGYFKLGERVRLMDTISSLSSGTTNVIKDVLGLSISLLPYKFMLDNWGIFNVGTEWWVFVLIFVLLDFQGYWTHRWAHQINLFWNKHAIHHSSEEFDLACALRQSISTFVNLFTFFLIPAAIIGVPFDVIAIMAPLHLFAQFWYHTRYIGKLGFLEHIIVTPSHHRVHHAINPEYMDRNHSQIFIIWDKLFGTFQEEQPNIKPVYGITRPAHTWNPFKINFQHLWLLIRDAWRASSWWDKLRIWWMPTGWRPEDVAEKYPVEKIDNVYAFQKYDPPASTTLKAWSIFQLVSVSLLLNYLFDNLGQFRYFDSLMYGAFALLAIYSLTEHMDLSKYAPVFEFAKVAFGLALVWGMGSWFGIDSLVTGGTIAFISYLLVGFVGSLWLTFRDRSVSMK